MKRWLVIWLAVTVLLSVCGCSAAGTKTKITRKTGTTASATPNTEVENPWGIDNARGHYIDTEAYPTMSAEQPEAAVSDCYFTNNGHLCVKLLISNGTDQALSIDTLNVAAYDYANDDMVGGGIAELGGSLIVMVADVAEYALYIAPEHVYVDAEASVPEQMYFEIIMEHSSAEDVVAWYRDEARGHFVDETAAPELSDEGPVAAVSESYFTNNGHLCVELLISNGTEQPISVRTLDVSAYDFTTEALIGGGKVELEEPLDIEVAGTEVYAIYIAPEHLQVEQTAVLPEQMSFDVTIDYQPIEAE